MRGDKPGPALSYGPRRPAEASQCAAASCEGWPRGGWRRGVVPVVRRAAVGRHSQWQGILTRMSASQAEEIAGVRPILKRVVTNAGMLLGGRTVNAVLSLAYMAIAARALGVRELGVLVLIQAFAQFLGDVVKFQSWQTIIHYGTQPLDDG